MTDKNQVTTIYLGQIPSYEFNLAVSAARELKDFVITSSYGPGEHYDVTPQNKTINVTEGNLGLRLQYPANVDAGEFWTKFFELKGKSTEGARSPLKEAE